MRFAFRQRLWSREMTGSYANLDLPVRNPNLPRHSARLSDVPSSMSSATRSLLLCFRRAVTVLPFLNGED